MRYTVYLKTFITKYFGEFRGFYSITKVFFAKITQPRSEQAYILIIKPHLTLLDTLFRKTIFREMLSRHVSQKFLGIRYIEMHSTV